MRKFFETERLVLAILDESDSSKVLEYYIRNRDFLQPWEPLRSSSFYTYDFQSNRLRNDLDEIKKGMQLRVWIFEKNNKNDRKVIGTMGFDNIIRGALLSCHVGYSMDQDQVNKGYMTEALKKGIDIIFNEYKLHRIQANIMPRNLASLKVVEKLGFHAEGIGYKYLKVNNVWEDHIYMVLLNDKII